MCSWGSGWSHLELLDLLVQQVHDVELLLLLGLLAGVSLPRVRRQAVAGQDVLLTDGDVLQVPPLDGSGLLLGEQLPDHRVHTCSHGNMGSEHAFGPASDQNTETPLSVKMFSHRHLGTAVFTHPGSPPPKPGVTPRSSSEQGRLR